MDLVSVSHGFGQLSYHFVFCPKYATFGCLSSKAAYRRDIFCDPEVKSTCERIFREIAELYGFVIYELQVMHDHVHLFVGFHPSVSVSRVVQLFKGISARQLFREFPRIKRKLWKGHLWSRGKFYRSVGNVTADTIKHYIAKSSGDWSRVLQVEEVQPPLQAQTSLLDYT